MFCAVPFHLCHNAVILIEANNVDIKKSLGDIIKSKKGQHSCFKKKAPPFLSEKKSVSESLTIASLFDII